jgi:hypothetical protein
MSNQTFSLGKLHFVVGKVFVLYSPNMEFINGMEARVFSLKKIEGFWD